VAKSGQSWFFPVETKKTTFFAAILNIQGGVKPPQCSSLAFS